MIANSTRLKIQLQLKTSLPGVCTRAQVPSIMDPYTPHENKTLTVRARNLSPYCRRLRVDGAL